MEHSEAWTEPCSEVGLAARNGDYEQLKVLISQGKPVDVADSRGWRPLHEASASNSPESLKCMEELLKQPNTDVDCQNHKGETAVFVTCKFGYRRHALQSVQMLVHFGANVNIADIEGVTPLLVATRPACMDIVPALLGTGDADTNLGDCNGHRPLQFAVRYGLVDLARSLVASGAQLNVEDNSGITPLYMAASYASLECLKVLLDIAKERGELSSVVGNNVGKSFSTAVEQGTCGFVRLIQSYGSKIRVSLNFEHVLLIVTIYDNQDAMLKQLLQVIGVDRLISDMTFVGEKLFAKPNPLHLSVKFKSHACLRVLLDAGFPVDSGYFDHYQWQVYEPEFVTRDPWKGFVDDLMLGLRNWLVYNWDYPLSETPLTQSFRRGDIESAKMLLNAGANREICGKEMSLCPPFFWSIVTGDSKGIDLLLEYGADFRSEELLFVAFVVPKNLLHVLRKGIDPPSCLNASEWTFFRDAIFEIDCPKMTLRVSTMSLQFLDHVSIISDFFTSLSESCRERFGDQYRTESWRCLLDSVRSPSSLSSLCRIAIRRHLLKLHGTSLGDRIESLQISQSLISYLNHEDILSLK